MKVKDLIQALYKLPQDLDIYINDPEETGGYIDFNQSPEVVKLVEYKSSVTTDEGYLVESTYIDKKEYYDNDDKGIIREFDAVEIVL